MGAVERGGCAPQRSARCCPQAQRSRLEGSPVGAGPLWYLIRVRVRVRVRVRGKVRVRVRVSKVRVRVRVDGTEHRLVVRERVDAPALLDEAGIF